MSRSSAVNLSIAITALSVTTSHDGRQEAFDPNSAVSRLLWRNRLRRTVDLEVPAL
jgi:hypothetical protein